MTAPHVDATRLAIVEIFVIAFVVLTTFVTDVSLLPALALLLIVAGVHLARREPLRCLLPNPRWAIAVLVTMSLVSLLVSTQTEITQVQVVRLLLGILLCATVMRFVCLWRCSANSRSAAGRALYLTQFAFVLLAFALSLASPFIIDWEGASKFSFLPKGLYAIFVLRTADSVNPNVMAGMLAMLAPLAAALFLSREDIRRASKERIDRLLPGTSLLVLILSSVILVLMQSRGAVLSFICAITVLVLLKWGRWRIIVGALLFLFLVLLLATIFLHNASAASNETALTVLGLDQRFDIWSRGMLLVQDFPLTGIGMGSFKSVTNLLYPFTLEYHEIPHAHNLFLQIAVDLGIPGLIAWLGILANVIVACITLIRSREPLLRAAGAGLLASNIALCVHGLTDAVTWGMVRTAPLVWALWGLTLGAATLCATSAQNAPQSSAATPPPAPTPDLPPPV